PGSPPAVFLQQTVAAITALEQSPSKLANWEDSSLGSADGFAMFRIRGQTPVVGIVRLFQD
ncbi:hypothetical protein, partial [Massilia antarctica]|uniref:hypothetical protein n=1 Tax=Massilia antarctica TaxID=2765360 RepID=UPI0035F069CD